MVCFDTVRIKVKEHKGKFCLAGSYVFLAPFVSTVQSRENIFLQVSYFLVADMDNTAEHTSQDSSPISAVTFAFFYKSSGFV